MKNSLLFFCFLFLFHSIFAQNTRTWIGPVNGLWTDDANWSGAVAPTATDTPNAGNNQFTIDFSQFATGTYQITGHTANGVSKTIRFVKQ